jgi:hypothetical protein
MVEEVNIRIKKFMVGPKAGHRRLKIYSWSDPFTGTFYWRPKSVHFMKLYRKNRMRRRHD